MASVYLSTPSSVSPATVKRKRRFSVGHLDLGVHIPEAYKARHAQSFTNDDRPIPLKSGVVIKVPNIEILRHIHHVAGNTVRHTYIFMLIQLSYAAGVTANLCNWGAICIESEQPSLSIHKNFVSNLIYRTSIPLKVKKSPESI